MADDDDLVPGTIGLSSWTRVYVFKSEDYDAAEAQRFMDVNSCRFDPEGFCRQGVSTRRRVRFGRYAVPSISPSFTEQRYAASRCWNERT